MWAITPYYNPARYRRRLENFRQFRAMLAAPLIAIELSFDGEWELAENDADVVLRLDGGAVLWQKERLINVAVNALPTEAACVAWIDCDVVFGNADWAAEAEAELRSNLLVQLYSEMVDLPPNVRTIRPQDEQVAPSAEGLIAAYRKRGDSIFGLPGSAGAARRPVNSGLAWAAQTAFIRRHGLYDAMIAGSGGRAMAYAMFGRFEDFASSFDADEARRRHFLRWARPYHVALAGRIGFVSGRLYHLWHGDIENRAYRERHRRLAELGFAPDADLEIGENGAWRWARSRPDLAKFFATYFASRAEDGGDRPTPSPAMSSKASG